MNINLKQRMHTAARLAFAGGGLLYCLIASAAPDATLAQQLEQLRRAVSDLEVRVQQLELSQQTGNGTGQVMDSAGSAQPPAAPAAANSGSSIPAPVSSLDPALLSLERLRNAWKRISTGMNTTQVREQLGEPEHQFVIDGKPVWHYSYPGVGSGSIMFSTAGKVIGAQNPPFGFW